LLARRAETAVHGAAGLGGDAQGAAVVFRDEHGFHGIAIAYVNEPLARAIRRRMVADDGRGAHFGARGQLVAQRLGQVRHGVEIGSAELVYPALQLFRTKRFLSQLGAVGDELRGIKVQQVGEGRRIHDLVYSKNPSPRASGAKTPQRSGNRG